MCSCEFCEVFKYSFFIEDLWLPLPQWLTKEKIILYKIRTLIYQILKISKFLMDYILMYEEIVMLIFLTCIYLYSQYAKKPQYVKWLIDCFKMKGHYKKKKR